MMLVFTEAYPQAKIPLPSFKEINSALRQSQTLTEAAERVCKVCRMDKDDGHTRRYYIGLLQRAVKRHTNLPVLPVKLKQSTPRQKADYTELAGMLEGI